MQTLLNIIVFVSLAFTFNRFMAPAGYSGLEIGFTTIYIWYLIHCIGDWIFAKITAANTKD